MRFVGPVTSFRGVLLRPHDLDVSLEPRAWSAEAMIERLVHLGFEVRAELLLSDGQRLLAQLSREEAQELDLERGQIVYVRTEPARVLARAE